MLDQVANCDFLAKGIHWNSILNLSLRKKSGPTLFLAPLKMVTPQVWTWCAAHTIFNQVANCDFLAEEIHWSSFISFIEKDFMQSPSDTRKIFQFFQLNDPVSCLLSMMTNSDFPTEGIHGKPQVNWFLSDSGWEGVEFAVKWNYKHCHFDNYQDLANDGFTLTLTYTMVL